jgi:hypothetical protein
MGLVLIRLQRRRAAEREEGTEVGLRVLREVLLEGHGLDPLQDPLFHDPQAPVPGPRGRILDRLNPLRGLRGLTLSRASPSRGPHGQTLGSYPRRAPLQIHGPRQDKGQPPGQERRARRALYRRVRVRPEPGPLRVFGPRSADRPPELAHRLQGGLVIPARILRAGVHPAIVHPAGDRRPIIGRHIIGLRIIIMAAIIGIRLGAGSLPQLWRHRHWSM